MIQSSRKVLVVAPHTDDAELGCGGTMARLLEQDTRVYVAVFSTAEDSLPAGVPKGTLKREFLSAMSFLGLPEEQCRVFDFSVRRLSYSRQDVLEKLIDLRKEIDPDLVFIPSAQDLHQDHQVVYAEGVRAFKDCSLLGYEFPWNHLTFSSQAFVKLEARHMEMKWNVLQRSESQIALNRSYFTREFIESLARVRGVQVKTDYAECFEVIRIKC